MENKEKIKEWYRGYLKSEHWHKEEYDALVRTILAPERVTLWNRAETDRKPHKMDWELEIVALKQELKNYERA